MKSKKVKTSSTLSTKEVILKESLALINENGMMDFRIDVLAMALDLSPGNITYHFAKKEDISISLWKQFIREFSLVSTQISALLDIKQSFLVLKRLYSIMDCYKGVVMFVNSNVRLAKDPAYNGQEMRDITTDLFDSIIKMLYKNGYLNSKENPNILCIYQSVIMQWALNKSVVKSAVTSCSSEDEINQNALLVLFSFYNIMNDNAKKEYEYVRMRVAMGDV